MNPERWRHIERIYHLALERPPRAEAFVKDECHNDAGLQHEVHVLLRQAASWENVLDEPAAEAAAQVMTPPNAPAMPDMIGRYRVTGAPAWARLGHLYRVTGKFRGEQATFGRAESALNRAFELNPDISPPTGYMPRSKSTTVGRKTRWATHPARIIAQQRSRYRSIQLLPDIHAEPENEV